MRTPGHLKSILRRRRYVLVLALFAGLVAVYYPIVTGPAEFNGDDFYFIVDNERVTGGLTLGSLASIWLMPMKYEYFPVTITSYLIDHSLWGLAPKMYRLTNLVVVFLIALTAFSLSVMMNEGRGRERGFTVYGAALASVMLLLLHPVNVESVASISNRKELLYVLFGLLSLRFYIKEPSSAKTIVPALLLLVMAQLSKGTAVVLPLIFLSFEVLWRRGGQGLRIRILPLLSSILVSSVIFIYQFSVALKGVVKSDEILAFAGSRLGGVVRTANLMVGKFLLPLNLTYEYSIEWPDTLTVGLEWLLPALLLISMVVLLYKKQYRYLFLESLLIIPLLPYMNIVPLAHGYAGNIVFYEHYLLFTTMAASPLMASLLVSSKPRWKLHLVVLFSAITVLFAIQDNYLSRFWRTTETLYARIIRTSPDLPRAYVFLGNSYLKNRRYEEAIVWLEKAFSLDKDANALLALADAYAFSGRYAKAEKAYRLYLQNKAGNQKALQNLSNSLIMQNKFQEAQHFIDVWLSLSPNDQRALAVQDILNEKKKLLESKSRGKGSLQE
jgi:tetratricopeptide (TPR) repeat protein